MRVSSITKFWPAIQRRLQNRRFWRDSSLLMLANIFAIGLGLIKTPAMTWLLSKDEVGMIGVVTAWSTFLVFLTWPSNLSAATYHYVAKGQPAAFIIFLKHQLPRSLFSVLGFWASGFYWWYWQDNSTLAVLFVIAGLTYPTVVVLAASGGMLGAQEKFVELFWYRIGYNLSRFVGFLFLLGSLWWGSQVITFYTVNQIALTVLHIGVTIWLVRQLVNQQTTSMPSDDQKEMIRYGKHQTGITAISIIQSNIDSLLISTFMPLTVMADYTIALLAYAQLKGVWMVYLSVRYPPLVRLSLKRRQRRIVIEGFILWLGFAMGGIGLGLVANWIVPVVLPPSYISSLEYMYWLLAIFVVAIPGYMVIVYFRTEQNEKGQYIMQSVSTAFGVALPLILIYPLGVYGILLGRFLSSLLLSVVGGWMFWRDTMPKHLT